jgi:hypothetical protein
MVVLFLYFALTVVAVQLWMIIIQSKNVLYEVGGAVATTLALYSFYWYMSWHFAQSREVPHQHPSSPSSEETPEQRDERELHERLEEAYGSGVHTFLVGGRGLTVATINSLLAHSTYKKGHPLCSTFQDLETNASAGKMHTADDCLECSVCLAGYSDGEAVTVLPCNHAFHRGCITSWLLSRNLCPMCKQQPVKLGDLTAALDLSVVDTELQDISSASDAHSLSPRPVEGTNGSPEPQGCYVDYLFAQGVRRGIDQLLRAVDRGFRGRRPSRRASVVPLPGATDDTLAGTDRAILSETPIPSTSTGLQASTGQIATSEGAAEADLEAPPAGRAELAGFRPLSISDLRGIHSP